MKHFWIIPIAFVALVVPVAVLAGSGQTGFDAVVDNIETRYHAQATRIPFMGIISLVARKASNGGASGLHVAEFDNFTAPVDGEELNQMVEQKLGPGWELMIRETHRKPQSPKVNGERVGNKGNEQTLIYVRPEGQRMALFVLDLDGHEMDVVQVSVDPDHLNQSINRYKHHDHDEDRDADDHDGGASN